jgi:hypothetical protein
LSASSPRSLSRALLCVLCVCFVSLPASFVVRASSLPVLHCSNSHRNEALWRFQTSASVRCWRPRCGQQTKTNEGEQLKAKAVMGGIRKKRSWPRKSKKKGTSSRTNVKMRSARDWLWLAV